VIYPNVGGRFTFSAETCAAINARLRAPLGRWHRRFPAPGGGIDAARVPQWIERYGADTIFLIAGACTLSPTRSQLQDRWSGGETTFHG